MKTLVLFLIASTVNAQTPKQPAPISPFLSCIPERNAMMRVQPQASANCQQAIRAAKKCCANGENGCTVEAIPVVVNPGFKATATAALAGEDALQRGLAQNRDKCYEAREKFVEKLCADPADEPAKLAYKDAHANVIDCIDRETIGSIAKQAKQGFVREKAEPRPDTTAAEITSALRPSR